MNILYVSFVDLCAAELLSCHDNHTFVTFTQRDTRNEQPRYVHIGRVQCQNPRTVPRFHVPLLSPPPLSPFLTLLNKWSFIQKPRNVKLKKKRHLVPDRSFQSCVTIVHLYPYIYICGLLWWLSGKESCPRCRKRRRCGFNPWIRKIPWRRKWQPTPGFLAGKSHGQGAWWATVHGVAKSRTGPNRAEQREHTHMHTSQGAQALFKAVMPFKTVFRCFN